MTTPINLNKVRKTRARAEKAKRGDENAIKFGRSKSEKRLDAARADQDRQKLDGHKRGS